MFDIDFMNKTGLQKIISKANVSSNTKKHDLIFGDLDSSQDQNTQSYSNSSSENSESSIFSLILAMLILSAFISLGIFKFNEEINFQDFSSYFSISDTSNIEVSKSLIVGFLSNSQKIGSLNSIDIDQDLELNISINEISDLNLKSREIDFLNIIEDKEFYNASFNVPLGVNNSDADIDLILLNLLNKYEDRLDVFLRADGEAIYFTSNGKIIYEILDQLIFIKPINIVKNSNKHFTLRFPY